MSSNGQYIAALSYGGLFTSGDGGATWTRQPAAGDANSWQIAMSSNGQKLMAITSTDVYTSVDGGTTWTIQAAGNATALGLTSLTSLAISGDGTTLAMSASDSSYIYHIVTSVDGGATWTIHAAMPTNTVINSGFSSNLQTIVAGTSGANLYISHDLGSTWQQKTVGDTYSSWYKPTVSADGSTITFISNVGSYSSPEYRLRSTDGGTTWTQQQLADVSIDPWYLTGSGNSLTTMFASENGNLYTSQDGGIHWSMVMFNSQQSWASMAMTPDGTKLALASYDGTFYTSTDGGTTWVERINDGDNFYDIGMSDDGQKLATVNYKSFITLSNDGGATWVQQVAPGSHPWKHLAMSTDGNTIIAGAAPNSSSSLDDTVFISTDGGTTWSELPQLEATVPVTGPTDPFVQWSGFAVSHTGQYMAAVQYPGILLTSNNRGQTWATQTTPGSQSWQSVKISDDGKTIVGVTDSSAANSSVGDIYITHDGGATWTTASNAGSHSWSNALALSPDGQIILAGTFSNGGAFLSIDGGATWAEQTALNTPDAQGDQQWWSAATLTPDGSKLAIIAYDGMLNRAVPSSGGSGPPSSTLPTITNVMTNSTQRTIQGLTVPRAQVSARFTDGTLLNTTAQNDGTFMFTVPMHINLASPQTVILTAIDTSGQTSAPTPATLDAVASSGTLADTGENSYLTLEAALGTIIISSATAFTVARRRL